MEVNKYLNKVYGWTNKFIKFGRNLFFYITLPFVIIFFGIAIIFFGIALLFEKEEEEDPYL